MTKLIIKNEAEFNTHLKGYVRATKTAMNKARALSEFALAHFEKCGDLGPAQRFHDSMIRNYSRQPAFIKWMCAHAPVLLDNKKFLKDKRDEAIEFDLAGAAKKPFWEFSPELGITSYQIDDIDLAILATLKKFDGKNYVAADDAAMLRLEKLKLQFELDTSDLEDAA